MKGGLPTIASARGHGEPLREALHIGHPHRLGLAELVLELLIRISGYRDDITLLAVQRMPAVEPPILRVSC